MHWKKFKRFTKDYQLSAYDANFLTRDKEIAHYFERVLKTASKITPKLAANWIIGDLAAALNKENITIQNSPVSAQQLARLLMRIHDKTISGNIAKQIFEAMWKGGGEADSIIEKQGLKQINNANMLGKVITEIITSYPQQTKQYRTGKDKLIAFFIGKVMRATGGKANPQQVKALLLKKLKS